MTATAMSAPVVNGLPKPAQSMVNEALEYEKILKLRDEIFAGSHPRLSDRTQAARKVLSTLPQSSTQSHNPLVPSSFTVSSAVPSVVPAVVPIAVPSTQPSVQGSNTAPGENQRTKGQTAQNDGSSVKVPTTTASGIDPVLLTKSADLVRAELQILRTRLEKSLRDQFDQKRFDMRKRPALSEGKPDFDINTVLARAWEAVRPEGFIKPTNDKEASDSFDENSFYSSKAPDSTPDARERTSLSHEPSLQEGTSANAPAEHTSNPFASNAPGASGKPGNPAAVDETTNNIDDDDDEEGEYSPPEPVEQHGATHGTGQQAVPDPRSRPLRRYSEVDGNGKHPRSPENANARNDRQPRYGRNRGRAVSLSESPEAPVHARKKRRVEKKAEKRAKKVKQEAVSPPPFHEIQPLGAGKSQRVADPGLVVIDDQPTPPRISTPSYIQSRGAGDEIVTPVHANSPVVQSPMVVSEGRGLRRIAVPHRRDEENLRRVASMHNLRAEQPREYVEYAPSPPTRATSYIRVDSPARMQPPHDYGIESEPLPQQEVRVVRTPALQYRESHRELEPEVRYIPEPMPPPTRERIVVDQYGNRFREVIRERASVTPRMVPAGYTERESVRPYDPYEPSRATSVIREERPGAYYPHDMPPPRMMRPAADVPMTPSISSTRLDNAQMAERSIRQTVYGDDAGDYRAPVRMSSVRPPPSQYDDQPRTQLISRASSVRPGRESSVFLEERAPVPREYVSVEAPRYKMVEQEPRFVDAQGRELIRIDNGVDGSFRYAPRY